jgi:EAL domain-containing protein (putative c-di-GMP-specific phosphodiesterase class I)
MAALRRLGLRFAMDDFGTGWSSLGALAGLPLDVLKVDGSFVAGLDTPKGEALVRAVVDLGGALGLRTIAEGIEQPWQLEKVLALGCHGAQGYLLGRPCPVPAFESAFRVDTVPAA